MKNKKTLNKNISTEIVVGIVLLVAVIFGIVFYFKSKKETDLITSKVKQIQDQKKKQNSNKVVNLENWKTYTNNEFYFTFKYPDSNNGALLSVHDNIDRASEFQNGAQLLYLKESAGGIQGKPQDFYFYINILAAKDAQGRVVTNIADFLKDYSLRRVNRIKMEYGQIDNVSTIEDIWPTKDSGIDGISNESKTVYAYYEGLIYEITIISNSGIPADIMSTFHFLTPGNE